MSIAHTSFGRVIYPAQQIRVDLVARLRLGCTRTAIERLYPHPPHQRFDMTTADLAPIGRQQALQHPRAGERKLQMQPVETPHHLQVGRRYRTRPVVDAATADAQNLRLLCDRQIVFTVNSCFALIYPALMSAPSKKSFSNVISSDPSVQRFTSTAGSDAELPSPGS